MKPRQKTSRDTISEQLFEEYLISQGYTIICRHPQQSSGRAPDYLIRADSQEVYCEVTEIQQTKLTKRLNEMGTGVTRIGAQQLHNPL
jgi:hypothetical protein